MKLNILYMHSHYTGRTFQPFGHAVETTKIKSLDQ